MHQTTQKAMLTIKSENRKIESVWWNKKKTQIMINLNECTYECAILSAWNERRQSHCYKYDAVMTSS